MDKLGIQPLQLGTQIFNFVIMVAILTRFLYKPILKTLKDRKDKIAEGLAYTEKMKAEAEKTESKRVSVINAAKQEAQNIIEESKKSGKQVEAEIIAKAHEDAHAILEKGKSDIELARADMERKLKEQTIDVAEAIAFKVLEATLGTKTHKAIIDKKIRAIAKQLD